MAAKSRFDEAERAALAARRHAVNQAIGAGDLAALPRLLAEADHADGRVLFGIVAQLIDRGEAARLFELRPLAKLTRRFPRFVWECLSRHYRGDARGLDGLLADDPEMQAEQRDCARLWAVLLQSPALADLAVPDGAPETGLVQFWDDPATLPADIAPLMAPWRALAGSGYRFVDKACAADFLRDTYGAREAALMLSARHPAIMADYFRLGYLAAAGGVYLDTDSEIRQGTADLWRRLPGRTAVCFQTINPWITINTSFIAAAQGSALMQAAFEEGGRRLEHDPDLPVLRLCGPVMLREVAARLHRDGRLDPGLAGITNGQMRRQLQRPFKAGYKTDRSDTRHWTHWQRQQSRQD